MKFFKLVFAIVFSLGLILAGYYFIWNFIANKRMVEIVDVLENAKNMKISYKNANVNGYPDNINITFDNVMLKTQDVTNKLNYKLGDVLFKIYPFVLEQQAEIKVPASHAIYLEFDNKVIQFKLQTSDIEISFLEGHFNLNFVDFKLFDVNANKLLVSADNLYYTGYMDNPNSFKINANNLDIKGKKVDSALLDLELQNFELVEFYASILKLLALNGEDYNQQFNNILTIIKESKSQLNINNLKYVNGDVWYEFSGLLALDGRLRTEGSIEIVSNNVNIVQSILRLITANDDIDITQVDLIKRLITNNGNGLVRISAKIERGFLKIFNEKITRVKTITK